jgi:hypothetical protein
MDVSLLNLSVVSSIFLLYRVYSKPSGESIHQIVLPRQLRDMILKLGHDIPLAGHLGNKKTRDRIMQHFFGQVYFMIY